MEGKGIVEISATECSIVGVKCFHCSETTGLSNLSGKTEDGGVQVKIVYCKEHTSKAYDLINGIIDLLSNSFKKGERSKKPFITPEAIEDLKETIKRATAESETLPDLTPEEIAEQTALLEIIYPKRDFLETK